MAAPFCLRLAALAVHAKDTKKVANCARRFVCALKEADGNRTKAAAKIGMNRRTLHRKLHEYHLEGN